MESSCSFCERSGLAPKCWYLFRLDGQKVGVCCLGAKSRTKICACCARVESASYLGRLGEAQGDEALPFFLFHLQSPSMGEPEVETLIEAPLCESDLTEWYVLLSQTQCETVNDAR